MRAYDAILRTSWAITPDGLQTLLAIANRDGTDAMLERALERRAARLQSVAAMDGTPIDDTKAIVRDGIATLFVTGPIVRYADIFSEISGATSIETLAKDFTTVMGRPDVRGVILNIDSPGGDINGIAEMSRMVYAARDVKPIIAYVSDLGASAAYWIAAAADEIVAAATAIVGSIGVIAAVRDPSKQSARDIEFVSSQSPRKRSDPTTETGKADIQAVVDALASVFVADIATYRGVSEDTVLNDFGRGGVLVGQAAKDAGLVDRLGSYESVLAELAGTRPRDMVWIPGGGKRVPASRTAQGESMATMMERFWAKFGAMDEDEVKVAQAEPAIGHPQGTQIPGGVLLATGAMSLPAVTAGADLDEIARLRTELAKVKAEKITAEAEQFYATQLAAHKVLPAERTAVVDIYTTLASEMPDRGPAMLTALYAARPAHIITAESLPVTDATKLATNRDTTPSADAAKEATPEERQRLLNMTPVGKQAIAAKHT